MKVTREKTEACQAYLTVEMEPAEMTAATAEGYRHLAKEVKIPGFRRGKAPRQVIERYLGKAAVLEEAVDHVLPEAYQNALKEQQLEPIAQPEIEIVQTEPALVFKAVVPLRPEVKLGDYRQIKVASEQVSVTEDNINAVIEQLRHQHATWEPVARGAAFGDLITMDVASTIGGEPFVNQKGVQYFVLQNAEAPLKGFPEQLVDVEKNAEKEFTLTVPEGYRKKEWVGKEASFKVKVSEIKGEKLPEIDDEFARQVNPEFAGVSAMREQVAAGLKERAELRAKQDFEDKAIDAAVAGAQVDFPPIMVEAEIDRLIDEQSRRMQMDEKALDQYLKNMNKTREQLREELRPTATKRIASSLVLGKIADEEKIDVSTADIDAEIERMAQNVQGKDESRIKDILQQEQSRQSIKQVLLTRQTVARLAEIAGGEREKKESEKEVQK